MLPSLQDALLFEKTYNYLLGPTPEAADKLARSLKSGASTLVPFPLPNGLIEQSKDGMSDTLKVSAAELMFMIGNTIQLSLFLKNTNEDFSNSFFENIVFFQKNNDIFASDSQNENMVLKKIKRTFTYPQVAHAHDMSLDAMLTLLKNKQVRSDKWDVHKENYDDLFSSLHARGLRFEKRHREKLFSWVIERSRGGGDLSYQTLDFERACLMSCPPSWFSGQKGNNFLKSLKINVGYQGKGENHDKVENLCVLVQKKQLEGEVAPMVSQKSGQVSPKKKI